MKKLHFLLNLSLSLLAVATTPLYAIEQTYGDVSYGKETLDSIQAFGVVSLDGTTVTGDTQISGRLEAREATLDSLQIYGKVSLKNCVVKGTTDINGALIADKTKFQDKISISSHEISFSACQVDSITVRGDKEFQGTQIIEARDGTKISGTITFESGNGELWLSSDSTAPEQIKGGKILKK